MRLKSKLSLAALLVAIAVPAGHAALAPQYDRMKQFLAVMTADVVNALASHGPVTQVIRQKDGTFEVWAGECLVMVKLTAIPPPQGMAGATNYEVGSISPVACK